MQTENKAKSFAFKLATDDAKQKANKQSPWQVRDGIAVAGCTGPDGLGNYRDSVDIWGVYRGRDKGYYC